MLVQFQAKPGAVHHPSFKFVAKIKLLMATAVLASSSVFAQSFEAVQTRALEQDSMSLGLGVYNGNKYMGSENQRTLVFPLIDYQTKNGFFAGVSNGIGYTIASTEQIQYGVRLTADFGRKESLDKNLLGLGDIKLQPEIGGFLNYSFSPEFQVSTSVKSGSTNNHKGVVLDYGVNYKFPLSQQLHLSIGAGSSWANADYMQAYFGVTQDQAKHSQYSRYTAKAGFRDLRANINLYYHLNPQLSLMLGISGSKLLEQAKNSPLADKTSSVGIFSGVIYHF